MRQTSHKQIGRQHTTCGKQATAVATWASMKPTLRTVSCQRNRKTDGIETIVVLCPILTLPFKIPFFLMYSNGISTPLQFSTRSVFCFYEQADLEIVHPAHSKQHVWCKIVHHPCFHREVCLYGVAVSAFGWGVEIEGLTTGQESPTEERTAKRVRFSAQPAAPSTGYVPGNTADCGWCFSSKVRLAERVRHVVGCSFDASRPEGEEDRDHTGPWYHGWFYGWDR